MARKQVLVQLSPDLIEALDREADATGTSRSAVLREAATRYLADSERARMIEAYVEGYRKFPQTEDEIDEWGSLGAWAEAALIESMRALKEEERAAGLDPPA